jgi:hypothetical protein
MSLNQWVQDTLKAAAAYIKRDKLANVQRMAIEPMPKKKHKPRKKAKKLKKAA